MTDECPTCGDHIEIWWFQCLNCRILKKEEEHSINEGGQYG